MLSLQARWQSSRTCSTSGPAQLSTRSSTPKHSARPTVGGRRQLLSHQAVAPSKSRTDEQTEEDPGPRGEGESFGSGYLKETESSPIDVKKVADTHPEGDLHDLERPRYHVMGRRGWTSDPCGPAYMHGWYHLFFQAIPDSADWRFGLCWGHAVSQDLVHWEHMPAALEPSKGNLDADGCFTGACLLDSKGIPTILYTGVRLRNNPDAGPPPPEEDDLGLPFFETQLCAAQADPEDAKLRKWEKQCGSILPKPPPEMRPANCLNGWRDPTIFEQPSEDNGQKYTMFVGNGVKDKGGVVLTYKSSELTTGWAYTGQLCAANTTEHGQMWECPLLIPLTESAQPPSADLTSEASATTLEAVGGRSHPRVSNSVKVTHALIVSPDAPTNPAIYWLGRVEDGKFLLQEAEGPFRVDIGNVAYAVNKMQDAKGRQILWAWLQENGRLPGDEYSYSGSESTPRELSFQNGRLVQRPLPELATLRSEEFWVEAATQTVQCEKLLKFPRTSAPAMDISFTLERGTANSAGLYIRSWRKGGHGSVAIVFDWKASRLDALFDVYYLDASTLDLKQEADPPEGLPEGEGPEGGSKGDKLEYEPEPRRVGGELDVGPQDPLRLRVLLDGSSCEVFTSTGTVLSIRTNRGRAEPGGKCPDIGFFAVYGEAKVSHVEAYVMDSCWTEKAAAFDNTPCKNTRTKSATGIDGQDYDPHVGRCAACNGLHRKGECPLGIDH